MTDKVIDKADRPGESLRRALIERLREAAAESAGAPGSLLRVEVPADAFDPLPWLCAQRPMSRGYWSDRENGFELAGVGRADMLTGFAGADYDTLMKELHRRIDTATGDVRYFGGMRFVHDRPGVGAWERFRAYRFILPRVELVRRKGATVFACNMVRGESLAQAEEDLANVFFDAPPVEGNLPAPLGRHDHPNRDGWGENVRRMLASFEPGGFEKVVLARETRLDFPSALNASMMFARLKEVTNRRFHFCFQPEPDTAFIGASPERFYRREGRLLKTEAVAGSRPRGDTPERDAELERELMNTEKDRREHDHVVRGIHESLAGLCEAVEVDAEPAVLQLARAQHLVTRFRATLREDVQDADILGRLHPTPAVGGVPTARALEEIARCEPFDRGWYAGPVGWVGRDETEFAVAIRAGLVEGSRLSLYSGAGIVEGSDPDEEWDEVENKIADFVRILG